MAGRPFGVAQTFVEGFGVQRVVEDPDAQRRRRRSNGTRSAPAAGRAGRALELEPAPSRSTSSAAKRSCELARSPRAAGARRAGPRPARAPTAAASSSPAARAAASAPGFAAPAVEVGVGAVGRSPWPAASSAREPGELEVGHGVRPVDHVLGQERRPGRQLEQQVGHLGARRAPSRSGGKSTAAVCWWRRGTRQAGDAEVGPDQAVPRDAAGRGTGRGRSAARSGSPRA